MAIRGKSFSYSEDMVISRNFPSSTDEEIGLMINRTAASIQVRRSKRLGLIRVRSKTNMHRYVNAMVKRMKLLIWICDRTDKRYIKDRCIIELKKLSGL